jgi:hypothetical protein
MGGIIACDHQQGNTISGFFAKRVCNMLQLGSTVSRWSNSILACPKLVTVCRRKRRWFLGQHQRVAEFTTAPTSVIAIFRQLPPEWESSVIFRGGRKEMEGAIYGLVEHPDTLAVLLLDVRGHFIVCGCGFDVHRKNIWTVWWLGVARQRTGGVLVDSRNSLLRRRLLHRIFLVQGDLSPFPQNGPLIVMNRPLHSKPEFPNY